MNILEIQKKYFLSQKYSGHNFDLLKKIVQHLNTSHSIILTGVLSAQRTQIINEVIIRTKKQDDFFYYNPRRLLYNHKETNNTLSTYSKNKKIIIIDELSNQDNYDTFIQEQISLGKKLIIISNHYTLTSSPIVEVLPEYNNIPLLSPLHETYISHQTNTTRLYYDSITHKIITQDILIENNIKNFSLLKDIITLISIEDELISVREINKILYSNGIKISHITLIEYIDYCLQSKLMKKVFRQDIKNNNISTGKAKYYFTDSHTRNSLSQYSLSKYTFTTNIIFQKLEHLQYTIYTGKNGAFDFSFIAESNTPISSKNATPNNNSINNKKSQKLIIHISKHTQKNEIKKEAKKLLKIPGNHDKYLIIDSIKNTGIRPSTYLPIRIMEIQEFI